MNEELDFSKDQHLMSIRKDGEWLGHIEIENGELVTNGFVGNNTYDNFVELIRGLQGHGLEFDDIFF
jgi:hypothetical protein